MSEGTPDINTQAAYWNGWNHSRSEVPGEVSRRQAEVVVRWLRSIRRRDLDVLDVGCGTGWLEPFLVPFGNVTALDFADEWVARAAVANPEVTFLAGDFDALPLEPASFDVVVSLEVLAHVSDQQAFVDRIASLLRPGGQLLLATQNRWVLEHLNDVPAVEAGQLRRWVDRRELRELLAGDFVVHELFSVTPRLGRVMKKLNRGSWRRRTEQPAEARGMTHPRSGIGWMLLERAGLGWTLMCRAERR